MERIYLDHAATTPLAPEVRAAMEPFWSAEFGNPSSRHALGVRAARALELAREQVAQLLGVDGTQVVFTSGGTEANNLAVLGLARARAKRGRHVLIGPTEHPCVRDAARALLEEGFELETLRLDARGGLDLEHALSRLRPDTVLVAQMLVNNEFGTLYPVARLARLVRANAPQACVHVDAVQALGKVEVSLGELGAHSLALSAHKFHGPKGAGALVLERGLRPRPLVFGGDQEQGLRSGTENVAGLVGLGCAAALVAERLPRARANFAACRAELARELPRLAGAELLEPAGSEGVVPAIGSLLLPGPPAEVWQHHLEARGVFTSVGSACQAKKGGLSPALLALGLDEARAKRVLRLSFARETSPAEVRAGVEALCALAAELRAYA
ncbi:MAG: cysteine desulfurase [Planctomycetes bacterium]|nr:cysteine desulfurase [Planctomycetota bacterium]